MKRIPAVTISLFSLIAVLQLVTLEFCYADDAVTLPKGRWRVLVDTHYVLPFSQRYNRDSEKEDYAKVFNVTLNNTVFATLPAGLNLGTTSATFNRHATEVFIQPAYGVTDKFSLGANIPYYNFRNNVSPRLNTTGANLGINPAVPGGLAPLSVPGTRPANVNDIQGLLASQFGIKRIEDWADSGIGDIDVGGRYQYLDTESWRAAFTGGVRFPTGDVDDPDNLVDSSFGRGAYALLFQFQQDYMSQAPGLGKRVGFPDPWEYLINTTIRYDLYLPDTETLRVCGATPFCRNKENVRRKVGDNIEAEISGRLGLLVPGLNISPLYRYVYKFKDHHTGDRGLDYGALAQELDQSRTEREEHIYIITLTYSTVSKFVKNQFPFPLAMSVSYRDRFAGSGGAPVTQYIGFTVQVFF